LTPTPGTLVMEILLWFCICHFHIEDLSSYLYIYSAQFPSKISLSLLIAGERNRDRWRKTQKPQFFLSLLYVRPQAQIFNLFLLTHIRRKHKKRKNLLEAAVFFISLGQTFVIGAMDSSFISNGDVSGFKDKESMVDPFLVEALQNPRHRVTSQCSLPLPLNS